MEFQRNGKEVSPLLIIFLVCVFNFVLIDMHFSGKIIDIARRKVSPNSLFKAALL